MQRKLCTLSFEPNYDIMNGRQNQGGELNGPNDTSIKEMECSKDAPTARLSGIWL